ncbi:response regulator [Burkholderia sp. 22PA0099]|uniref:response regulator n=1 Tax=Burkholderia sp. 22PA0099 TaxID=3237372 RepID=UPI0039C4218A
MQSALPETGRAQQTGDSMRVLLVDDYLDGLSVMEAYLTMKGFEVSTAINPVDAISVAGQFEPDVAILDIGLPGMDGYALAGVLRSQPRHAKLRLFALTGYGQSGDGNRAAAAGFERYFVKPIVLSDLAEALATPEGKNVGQ